MTRAALHQLTAHVSPYLRDALVESRERAHTHVMSAFPRADDSGSPRAELGILWHLDPDAALLTVRSWAPAARPGLLGDVRGVAELAAPSAGSEVQVRLFCNVQKTPSSRVPRELAHAIREQTGGSYRSRLVIVPEDERLDWAARRLERAGFRAALSTVRVGRVGAARLGRRGENIPAAEVTARAIVHDAELAAEALGNGVGKGKNYGLGLLRIHPLDAD